MPNPLVSVLMPVHDSDRFLPTTLESIENQDYQNMEVVIVNDGSTDGTTQILESFFKNSQRPIKIVSHSDKQNHGIAQSYKLGLQHCRGEYIAFLEHDDYWEANKISQQINVFEKYPEVGVVFSDVYTCDVKGQVAEKAFKTLVNKPPAEKPFNAFWRLLWGNCVSTFSNIMVRHSQVSSSDIINKPEGFQDWMLLLNMSSRCKFYHCNGTKIYWRLRNDSYHGKLRQLPQYKSEYRKRRKFALINAIQKIKQEPQNAYPNNSKVRKVNQKLWYSMISLFSTAERIIDFMNPQSLSKRYRFKQNIEWEKTVESSI